MVYVFLFVLVVSDLFIDILEASCFFFSFLHLHAGVVT